MYLKKAFLYHVRYAEIPPMVNQVECHPFFQQIDAMKTMKEYNVQIEAWEPFAEGQYGIFKH